MKKTFTDFKKGDIFKLRNDLDDEEIKSLKINGYTDEELDYLRNNEIAVANIIGFNMLLYVYPHPEKGDTKYGISYNYLDKVSSFCVGHPMTRIFKNLKDETTVK